MKKIFSITLCLSTLLLFVACDNFLDVQPEDKLTHEQVASSEHSINAVLNGIYMNMAQNTLYGANLSTTIVECMAQRYNVPSQHSYYNYGQYLYKESSTEKVFNSIWEEMYVQILSINEFMEILNGPSVNIPTARKNILLGEAYALRAFHHFDLLRLYGPIYNSPDSTSITMAYNDVGKGLFVPLLPANQVMDKIVADLKRAETLLQYDPIYVNKISTDHTTYMDPILNFYTNRHYRMNYYAVKALQARVYLWRGNKTAALAAAKAVIDEQSSNLFPWLPYANITTASNPDRVFSSELIFGIANRNMYANYDRHFAPNILANGILAALPDRLLGATGAYENANDGRYTYIWLTPAEKPYRTFYKYARPNSSGTPAPFAYLQPLIRISELYYIAAECETDGTTALAYLNEVRRQRIVPNIDITDPGILEAEIRKEYVKEFYGEGQLFYYYKRKNIASIPDGSSTGNVTMTVSKYRVPLPLSEMGGQ